MQVEPVTALSPVVRTEIRDVNNGPVVATAPAGIIAHDFVTVSGSGPTPTGTIDFTFFTASAACSGASSTESGVALTPGGGVANSGPHGPLAAGSYSFLAHYGGDALYAPADSLCAPLEVIAVKATPRVETEIHREPGHTPTTSVPARSRVHDSATVSGSAGTPTGTVSFTFYASGDCSTGGTTQSNVPLSGGSAESSSHGPLAAGGYSFMAHYNGNDTYTEADAPCEPLTVTPRHGQCGDNDDDRGKGRVKDERDGHGGDFDFDECDDDHHASHRDTDRNVDFYATRHDAPTFELVQLAPMGAPALVSGGRGTTVGQGLNNGSPVTYILIVTDLGVGPGTDLYSLTLSDATGVIYTMTGTLDAGDIAVLH